MMTLSKVTVLTVALTALAACGGGGGGGGVANPIPEYVTFTSDAATDSALGGRLLVVSNPPENIRALSGSLRHNTRVLTDLTDGTRVLTNVVGTSGTWTDGTFTFQPANLEQRRYDFAAFYNFIDPTGPGDIVVVGVKIDASDVPSGPLSGSTNYSGTAFIVGSLAEGQSLSSTGTSAVTVDFTNNTADLRITNINNPFYDTLTIMGMNFLPDDRSAFSGGTLALMNGDDNQTVTLLGAGFSHEAFGDFFGIDSNDIPANVGGLFQANGDAGEIFGGFLAD